MSVEDLIARAKSARGRGIEYKLGRGIDPEDLLPGGGRGCDCTGFVLWVLGQPRRFGSGPNAPWIDTSWIWSETPDRETLFSTERQPRPGCLAVYPDGVIAEQGHVALVTEVEDGVVQRVIHCSSVNTRLGGEAILETEPPEPGDATVPDPALVKELVRRASEPGDFVPRAEEAPLIARARRGLAWLGWVPGMRFVRLRTLVS
jgi:CHAP domain